MKQKTGPSIVLVCYNRQAHEQNERSESFCISNSSVHFIPTKPSTEQIRNRDLILYL